MIQCNRCGMTVSDERAMRHHMAARHDDSESSSYNPLDTFSVPDISSAFDSTPDVSTPDTSSTFDGFGGGGDFGGGGAGGDW